MAKLREIFLQQLRQGATPEGLAWTCAIGSAVALFPVLGATTVLCLLMGALFRLNQPVLQVINYFLAPVQLLMIPVFLKMGGWVFGTQGVSINPQTMVHDFMADPKAFFAAYGWAGLQAILVWALLAPVLVFVVQRGALILFRIHKKRHDGQNSNSPPPQDHP